MTDENQLYDLSRRKVLAGIGAVGLASAGAGLGTSAFFSDTETYANNVLTAGALDLTVDWEEHYYRGGLSDLDIRYSISDLDAADQEMYVGFPTPDSPLVYVHESDVDQFMDDTTLEAYPDTNNDRVQDDLEEFVACDDFAQLDAQLNPENGRGAGVRSANADTILNYDAFQEGAAAEPAPLVNLDDVKPGDFGELTLSLHLCDNPGYIWMQGALKQALENGVTEPERSDDDEDQTLDADGNVVLKDPSDADGATVELLDEVQTMLWYDEDGDNVYEPGAAGSGEADIVIVMDTSGSMGGSKIANAKAGAKALVNAVGPNVRIALVEFSTQESLVQELTSNKSSLENAIDGLSTGGTTNIEGGVNAARDILSGTDVSAEVDPSVTGDSSTPNIAVVLSDGAPNVDDDSDGSNDPVDEATALKGDDVDLYTIAYGVSAGSTTAQTLEDMASSPKDQYAYLATDIDEAEAIFAQIGQIVAGEECFFQGSLRTLLELAAADPANDEFGIPLDGIRASAFDEITGDDTTGDGFVDSNYAVGAGDDPNRDPFVNSTTNAIGLAWWLPVDHANEIQTDSVTFDLGFYTEQARHNSGAGQPPESTPTGS